MAAGIIEMYPLNRREAQAGCPVPVPPYIRINCTEWIIGCFRLAGFGQGVEKGAFAYIGQTYDSSLEHNK